ncbi:Orotidine 5'-phosphate decarboxylase [Paraliobacillus sp. PM-2]|uniref:orotidine-5'-phosphate decarboxylase n=1 Tax=Paraliobacillus sp. PM-2 TaxID=1462524 RepID=UPI00061C3166|nr:orotidine-5'-phosphate decarboxylase [Paraliobacillus sp. PM-2]CQR47760.1 Orotidine 5'-phosphate decarboxylase [Paraliobacillus sp. PM-2]
MNEPIYLALDFPTWEQTSVFLQENHLEGIPVKVGMELFYREGPEVIKKLKKQNHAIFLDLKLHDIPTTIYKSMRNLAQIGVDFVNVHGFGGADMIKAAKQGLMDGTPYGEKQPKLLVVTVLTSMDQNMLNTQLGIAHPLANMVTHFSKMGKEQGADGVVCSAHEATGIKNVCGNDFLTVTPGIRLTDTSSNDQKRIATPQLAKQMGADYLVIGRSITEAEKPKQMYEQALKEWNHVD